MSGVVKKVGGFIGGLGGGFADAVTAQNPYMAQVNQAQGQFNTNIGNQNALAQMLLAQAQGQGPSVADAQLQMQTDENAKQLAGMVASQKGVSPALAARLGAQAGAQVQQDAAGQGALLRAQEQQGAMQNLDSLYGNIGNQLTTNQGNFLGVGQKEAESKTKAGSGFVGGLISGGSAALGKAHGGYVDGPEIVKGDSYKNDVVMTPLSGGEIIIPKTKAKDPEKAKAFIDHLMKEDEQLGFGEILERIKSLEKKMGKK